jgi:polyhydroxybutyrate depolymerase
VPSREVRQLARRALWAAPVALALLVVPAVGGTTSSSPHPAASARADDAAGHPAAHAVPIGTPSGSRSTPGSTPTSGSSAAPPAPRAPRHPAPPPGSPAYRALQQAWDAGDLGEARPAGTSWRSVRVDGVLRRYLLSAPAGRRTPAPLVVAFHGLGQRAGAFAAANGLVPATRTAGQVLVLPESSGPAFNDGRLGALGPQDDAFAVAVVRQLTGSGVADPRRVVVAGFSNGAGMAMEVAATHPHLVAAVVSIDGELIDGAAAPRPAGAVQAWLVHGTADLVQPWGGRSSAGPTWPAYVSESRTAQLFAQAAGAGTPTSKLIAGGPGRRRVTVQTWAPGRAGTGVTLYAIQGMGHVWPVGARDTVDATALVVHAAATAVLPAATGGA